MGCSSALWCAVTAPGRVPNMSRWFDARLFVEVFVTLFVIMDPPGTVPVFLGLTQGINARRRRRAAWQAVVLSAGVITGFAIFGQSILTYLGITVPALQAAGGLLLLLVALELLTGRAAEPEETRGVNVALVPLGTPLLAGPGAIVATIVFVRRIDTAAGVTALAMGIIAVHLCIWLSLRFAAVILRLLRESGVTVVTRIAGLLLSAIAVQLIADAVSAFIAAG
jgi:multiple antibiotic resistance protein